MDQGWFSGNHLEQWSGQFFIPISPWRTHDTRALGRLPQMRLLNSVQCWSAYTSKGSDRHAHNTWRVACFTAVTPITYSNYILYCTIRHTPVQKNVNWQTCVGLHQLLSQSVLLSCVSPHGTWGTTHAPPTTGPRTSCERRARMGVRAARARRESQTPTAAQPCQRGAPLCPRQCTRRCTLHTNG